VKLSEIIRLTEARPVVGEDMQGCEIRKAFSSDLMSDVLTLDADNILLITGLANIQLIRTAEMADIEAVVLGRGKKASSEMIKLAQETGLIILESPYSLFRISGILYKNGLDSVY